MRAEVRDYVSIIRVTQYSNQNSACKKNHVHRTGLKWKNDTNVPDSRLDCEVLYDDPLCFSASLSRIR